MTDALLPTLPALALLAAALSPALPGTRAAERLNLAFAIAIAGLALALAGLGLAGTEAAWAPAGLRLDPVGGAFLGLAGTIGLASVAASPAFLRHAGRGWFSARGAHAWYYASLQLFWAALLVLPLLDNLALAWLAVEATTAASALLVGFSGARNALEAGWKYLILTTLGLAVAMLGIVILAGAAGAAGEEGLGALSFPALERAAPEMPAAAAAAALVLIVGGLAAKIGWAPVHNWLPDAHSEAPPPVSAMLSAALLPTVMLVAWRTAAALRPATGAGLGEALFVGFGILSLAIAVPFLWRPLPWKRLLAYSSLEHMGVVALGIGFGTRLAIAGALLHVGAHGVSKALGFYASIPLLRIDRRAGRRPVRGIARADAATGTAVGIALLSLAGMPPSPVFVSEAMVLLGGIEAGHLAAAALAAVLLGLGFVGLAHAAIEGLLGRRPPGRGPRPRSAGTVAALTGVAAQLLAALVAVSFELPGSALVESLSEGGR